MLITLSSSLISHLQSSSASWCHMNCFSCPFLSLHSLSCQLKMHVNAHQCTRTAMRPAHASRRRKCRHGGVCGVCLAGESRGGVLVAEEWVSCLANMRFTASAGIGKKPTPVAASIESAR